MGLLEGDTLLNIINSTQEVTPPADWELILKHEYVVPPFTYRVLSVWQYRVTSAPVPTGETWGFPTLGITNTAMAGVGYRGCYGAQPVEAWSAAVGTTSWPYDFTTPPVRSRSNDALALYCLGWILGGVDPIWTDVPDPGFTEEEKDEGVPGSNHVGLKIWDKALATPTLIGPYGLQVPNGFYHHAMLVLGSEAAPSPGAGAGGGAAILF